MKTLQMVKIFLFGFILFCISEVNAQNVSPEIISSAGETFQGNTMQIDWTLGEVSITTIQDANQQITQGFHQPNYMITGIEKLQEDIGEIKIFPNPTSDWLEMNLNLKQSSKVEIQFFDFKGKLIWSENIQGQQISIQKNISDLPSGNYFLNFQIEGSKSLPTFKIQKIN